MQNYRLTMPSKLVIPLLILALAGLSTAQTPSSSSQAPTPTSSSSEPTLACGFIGDNNTYGLGIRLGIYLQWITTAIAYNFVPEEADTMRVVNFLFALSNFISLLYATATHGRDQPSGQLYTVEAWILLSFCIGGIFTGSIRVYQPKTTTNTAGDGHTADTTGDGHTTDTTGDGHTTDTTGDGHTADTTGDGHTADTTGKLSIVGRCFQGFLTSATTFYAVWFSYVGMDRMLHNPCSTYAFFFAKVNIYHWFRTFMKVFFTIDAAIICVIVILVFMNLVLYLILSDSDRPLEISNVMKQPPFNSLFTYYSSSRFTFFSNLILILLIVETEFVIKWNHIQEVNNISGTGQIIPVVLAGAGLVQVIWKWKSTKDLPKSDSPRSSTGDGVSAKVIEKCPPVQVV